MKKKNIYIIMEMAQRELNGNLLLTIVSLKKHFNVYISDTATFKYLLKKNLINPGIIHTKSITHGQAKAKFHQKLYEKNFKITAIDEEHGLLEDYGYEQYFITSRLSKKELEKIAAFFCWGKYDFEILRKYFVDFKHKFHLTGSPRSDIWKKKINFKINKQENKIFEKPVILICTNFAFSNNIYSYKNIIDMKKKEGYYERTPDLLKKDKNFYPYQKKLIIKFVDLINNLTKKFPNYNFCVRPHPVEKISYWHKKLHKRNNLHINNTGAVSLWIKNCKLMIQSGCTTGCEGVISDKLVINYVPVKYKGYGEFLKKISLNIKNQDKLFSVIRNLKKNNFNKFKSQRILNERIQFKSKRLAAENISNVWLKLSKNISTKTNNNFLIYFNLIVYENLKLILLTIILIARGKYGRMQDKLNYLNYKFPEIKRKSVENDIKILFENFNFKKKIKEKKLGKKLFFFK
jgi:surface carbohydrate biosynthesis protein